jgi:hypothetical protein
MARIKKVNMHEYSFSCELGLHPMEFEKQTHERIFATLQLSQPATQNKRNTLTATTTLEQCIKSESLDACETRQRRIFTGFDLIK